MTVNYHSAAVRSHASCSINTARTDDSIRPNGRDHHRHADRRPAKQPREKFGDVGGDAPAQRYAGRLDATATRLLG
jgi:hypothetical protein